MQIQVPGLNLNAAGAQPPTEVLCLMNMVAPEELVDEDEYDGMVEYSLWQLLFRRTFELSVVKIYHSIP